MATYFTEIFSVQKSDLDDYGAFNVSLVTDLPLFVDPFLLFNSQKPEYKKLHENMIDYLVFLRDKALEGEIDDALLRYWYCFPEVKQNWFGFSKYFNGGSGLGIDFAKALHQNLFRIFQDFGEEKITNSSHLEKVCLIHKGVGKDNVSDFTTNLIKAFLCEYTARFAARYLRDEQTNDIAVSSAIFNYETESWETRHYKLPWHRGDYVLLTPKDILTRDDTWINRDDLIRQFASIPESIDDDQLRARVNYHFYSQLKPRPPTKRGRKPKQPTQKDKDQAAANTIAEFPQLIDYFIKMKETEGDKAENISSKKVKDSQQIFINQTQSLQEFLASQTEFYAGTGSTYQEAHKRVAYLKDVIENKGGHRVFYKDGGPIERESDLQVMYRLVWFGTPSAVTTEANDGRGPADFKISRSARDNTIVEMKLAKNSKLKQNLQHQVDIYRKASDADNGIKVIMYFDNEELKRVNNILDELGLSDNPDVVLIDARNDNKPSGSKAR